MLGNKNRVTVFFLFFVAILLLAQSSWLGAAAVIGIIIFNLIDWHDRIFFPSVSNETWEWVSAIIITVFIIVILIVAANFQRPWQF